MTINQVSSCELRIRVLVTANNATFWYTVSISKNSSPFTGRTFYHFFVLLLCRSHFSSFEIKKFDKEKRKKKTKTRTKLAEKKKFYRFLHIFMIYIFYIFYSACSAEFSKCGKFVFIRMQYMAVRADYKNELNFF